MKRRDAKTERVARGPQPPPELAQRCIAAEWLTEDDVPPESLPGSDAAWWKTLRGWRHWLAARQQWLDEHQVPTEMHGTVIPYRRPADTPSRNAQHG